MWKNLHSKTQSAVTIGSELTSEQHFRFAHGFNHSLCLEEEDEHKCKAREKDC